MEVQGRVLVSHSAARTVMLVVDKMARVVDRVEEAVVTAARQSRQKHAPRPNLLNDRTLMLARPFASSSEPKTPLIEKSPEGRVVQLWRSNQRSHRFDRRHVDNKMPQNYRN